MGVLKSQFLTTRWPKTFVVYYYSYLVSSTGALPNYVCFLKHSLAGGGGEKSRAGVG
jgi:hypothetical protein